ncbi:MAG: cytochrome c biogenesis protein CcdA [Candidatus Spechtbacteria bacterium]|nr:cytochrome c biogenesis protein CcdA [Candidatus Spechtbacteria bacterium]
MDIIFSASILAAFLAGMVALFAPCCITVLLPAYLASALQERKNIIKMTVVFFFGVAAVLIPIGLGAAGLAQVFQNFHRELYIVGGAFMLILGVMAVLGKGFSLWKMSKIAPAVDASSVKSVFVLGLFSGAATSCCAPVLVGAVTLAVISGAFWKALIVVFAYTFGMTFPLFVAAYFYDHFKLEKSAIIRGRIWDITILGKTYYVHSTNLFAGMVFLIMGVVLLAIAFTGNFFWAPEYQVKIGEQLNMWSQQLFSFLSRVPDAFWGFIIIGLFLFMLWKAFSRKEQ